MGRKVIWGGSLGALWGSPRLVKRLGLEACRLDAGLVSPSLCDHRQAASPLWTSVLSAVQMETMMHASRASLECVRTE